MREDFRKLSHSFSTHLSVRLLSIENHRLNSWPGMKYWTRLNTSQRVYDIRFTAQVGWKTQSVRFSMSGSCLNMTNRSRLPSDYHHSIFYTENGAIELLIDNAK